MINPVQKQNKYGPSISFKEKIIPSAEQAKYFFKEYPLLGKFIPQHCFGFLQYDNTEFTRYMVGINCSLCSKLSIYDKVKKIGVFAHVDSEIWLLDNIKDIKKELYKLKMDPKDLVGTDKPGLFNPNRDKMKIIKSFFQQLGLKDENIHQPLNGKDSFDGGALDLKDGKIYDINSWAFSSKALKNSLKNTIEIQLENLPNEKQMAMEQFEIHYNRTYPTIRQKYTQV